MSKIGKEEKERNEPQAHPCRVGWRRQECKQPTTSKFREQRDDGHVARKSFTDLRQTDTPEKNRGGGLERVLHWGTE